MQFTLGHIAQAIDGILIGSPDKLITGVALIEEVSPGQITFASESHDTALPRPEELYDADTIITPMNYTGRCANVIKVEDTELAFAKTIALFHPKDTVKPQMSPQATIHSSAVLGKDVFVDSSVTIGARAVIGDRVVIQAGVSIGEDTVIGDDTTIWHNAVIMPNTQIGNRVVIQQGSSIGGDGFGYVKNGKKLFKIPHVGHVVIEDDVEMGACNTIERANLGKTLIEEGVKTGNLVHIGHNVTIGANTRVGAQVGIASNTMIGESVQIGPQAGIADNVFIGDHVVIGPQAGIARGLIIDDYATIGPQAGIIAHVAKAEKAYGTPGMSSKAWLRSGKLIPQLHTMRKDIDTIAQNIDQIRTIAELNSQQ